MFRKIGNAPIELAGKPAHFRWLLRASDAHSVDSILLSNFVTWFYSVHSTPVISCRHGSIKNRVLRRFRCNFRIWKKGRKLLQNYTMCVQYIIGVGTDTDNPRISADGYGYKFENWGGYGYGRIWTIHGYGLITDMKVVSVPTPARNLGKLVIKNGVTGDRTRP